MFKEKAKWKHALNIHEKFQFYPISMLRTESDRKTPVFATVYWKLVCFCKLGRVSNSEQNFPRAKSFRLIKLVLQA